MPPAIHSRITVSALEVIFLLLQEARKLLTGAPAANVANVAALAFLRKSLLFHRSILQDLSSMNKFVLIVKSTKSVPSIDDLKLGQ
jgi:hypothetical protein